MKLINENGENDINENIIQIVAMKAIMKWPSAKWRR
jgi:hypothetical protein